MMIVIINIGYSAIAKIQVDSSIVNSLALLNKKKKKRDSIKTKQVVPKRDSI